ncbi:hypothetical protein SeLEV6574_g04360 [Synchytrium endobioticum]|uniref:F-box domain-containing protein n=1 Tax=Synchytrium endobioticum TaxID=286115 RepID=A0A507D052_9FUNG|nr:hypothetical protein SeLEV6574_g04360 [Synchytrium endobioticum]
MADYSSESSGFVYTPVNARGHLPSEIEALDALVASSRRNIHTEHVPSLHNLPIELLVRVFEQTDAKTLRHIETACRGFHLIVSRYNIWDKCAPPNVTGSEHLGLSRKQVLGACNYNAAREHHRAIERLEEARQLATQYERAREARQRESLVRQVLARGVAHKWTKEELEQSATFWPILHRCIDITDAIWKILEPRIAEQVADYRIQTSRKRRSILIETLCRDYIRRVLKKDVHSMALLMTLEC